MMASLTLVTPRATMEPGPDDRIADLAGQQGLSREAAEQAAAAAGAAGVGAAAAVAGAAVPAHEVEVPDATGNAARNATAAGAAAAEEEQEQECQPLLSSRQR